MAPEHAYTVLVIDDDRQSCALVARFVERLGFETVTAHDGLTGLSVARAEFPDIIITDLQMPGADGIEVLREARRVDPQVVVMIMTGFASVETAVAAMKEGAFDYIQKPVNCDQVGVLLERAVEHLELLEENRELRARLDDRYRFGTIIGRSPIMHELYATIEKVAPTDANVMIWGESGSGKEMVAREIHAKSRRGDKPFVAVDCVALPDHLIESELFGHEKGAFTGADRAKEGLLETAQGGTFFMDEVTELNIDLQAKLLRVLQERQYRRVGGRELLDVDTRVVSATNRNPEEAVACGRLREDLLYRLNVIPIHLPPLRERPDDIPLLVQHFLERLGNTPGAARRVSPDAVDILQAYDWPGNVRELGNMIERLGILSAGDEIRVSDLPASLTGKAVRRRPDSALTAFTFKEAKRRWVAGFERRYLEQMLHRHGWNVSEAAELSGVNRKTFHRLIRKHGLERPEG